MSEYQAPVLQTIQMSKRRLLAYIQSLLIIQSILCWHFPNVIYNSAVSFESLALRMQPYVAHTMLSIVIVASYMAMNIACF